jgi:hypothetical protein
MHTIDCYNNELKYYNIYDDVVLLLFIASYKNNV